MMATSPHAASPRNVFRRGVFVLPLPVVVAASSRRSRRGSTVRLLVEALEDRTLPAVSISGIMFLDFNANMLRDNGDIALANQVAYLDLNHNGVLDGSRTVVPGIATVVPTALGGFGVGHADLTAAGLPARVSDLNVNLDITNTGTNSTFVIGLISPLGILAGSGANLVVLGPGQSFRGILDEQAVKGVVEGGSHAVGIYRPDQLFTAPFAHIYEGDPNGGWGLVFIGNALDDSGAPVLDAHQNPVPAKASDLTITTWSLDFEIA